MTVDTDPAGQGFPDLLVGTVGVLPLLISSRKGRSSPAGRGRWDLPEASAFGISCCTFSGTNWSEVKEAGLSHQWGLQNWETELISVRIEMFKYFDRTEKQAHISITDGGVLGSSCSNCFSKDGVQCAPITCPGVAGSVPAESAGGASGLEKRTPPLCTCCEEHRLLSQPLRPSLLPSLLLSFLLSPLPSPCNLDSKKAKTKIPFL